jgi:hypothetical protein
MTTPSLSPATLPCGVLPPLSEPEIVAAAQRMQFGHGGAGTSRLLRLLADPQLSAAALAQHIGAEPAVAVRVLRVANSAYYGHAAQVATLARAGQVLGVQALRGIALAACFDGISARPRGLVHPDMAAFRRHSLATACAAQELARAMAPCQREQAFMAGLLHDLGLLLLWRLRPATVAGEEPEAGLGHADCGRVLMQTWCLPAELTRAVAEHERHARLSTNLPANLPAGAPTASPCEPTPPSAQAEPSLGLLLALAEALAGAAGFGLAGDAACRLPAPGEPLHEACASAAAVLPAAAQRLLSALDE